MAYNNLSGTVVLPDRLVTHDLTLHENSILSGNLSTSDGASIINVPRVSNATNNAILTNVDGDANQLFCESNLTFNGSALAVVGQVSASLNISASYFYGDGSKLTGISAAGGGIFTQINGTTAYTTSSVTIGANTTPSHPLFVSGISHLSGGVIHKRVRKTANYSVTTSDYIIGVDTTAGTLRLTLPAAASALDGQVWVIKDEGGNAGNNNVTITGSSDADTIEGQKEVVLESPSASLQLYCDGTSKYFIF
jgi:hypothetical protein